MTANPVLFVSFSGGRTSAYMCHILLTKYAHKYDLRFMFANTGWEHEETLIFVDKCDKHFGLNLTWVEAVVNDFGKSNTHRVVTFESASRNCEPFEATIEKYGIPNAAFPHCTGKLKQDPMASWKLSQGFARNHLTAIGLRADEVDRQSEKAKENGLVYPLIDWVPTTKGEVVLFWRAMPFDLQIPEHLGNCVGCWKKSWRKLKTVAKHTPEAFDFTARMERDKANCGPGDGERVFFRKSKTTVDLLREAREPFIEATDYVPQHQTSIFDVLPDDIESGCGSACEIN